jgi:hypothetical protein
LFLTALAFLIGLSFLSSILVLAAVIRSGQVEQMAEERRRAALHADDIAANESDAENTALHPELDWTPTGRVASYPFSLSDRT